MNLAKGFAPLIVIVIAVLVAGAGTGGFLVYQRQKTASPEPQPTIDTNEQLIKQSEKTHSDAGKNQRARDPWNDPIPAAPINLVLPIAVKDINVIEGLLSPYGIIRHSRDSGIGHGGIDFPLAKASPIYAVANGTIIKNSLEESESSGEGKTVDVLIVPGVIRGEGWIFKYDHVNLEPGLAVGSSVQKGQKIGTNAFERRGNNHIGLEYHIKNFTIARQKICWVDRLETTFRQQLENEFNRFKNTSAFMASWQTANEEGYYQYKGLLDATKYPSGPRLCYSLGLDARMPLSVESNSQQKEIYGDRIPFYQKDRVSFEYYWPADPIASGLSAEETEILVHNESGKAVEISFVEVDFNLNGKNYVSPPGSWEKYPSRLSWNRIEYRIFPRGAINPSFTLSANQKGKLHYHFSFSESPTPDKPQSVKIKIYFSVGGTSFVLDQTVERPLLQTGIAEFSDWAVGRGIALQAVSASVDDMYYNRYAPAEHNIALEKISGLTTAYYALKNLPGRLLDVMRDKTIYFSTANDRPYTNLTGDYGGTLKNTKPGFILTQPISKDATLHEFGHIVGYHGIEGLYGFAAPFSDLKEEYDELFDTMGINYPPIETPRGYISSYATANKAENFAEHFANYVFRAGNFKTKMAGDALLTKKYDFFEKKLFLPLENRRFTAACKKNTSPVFTNNITDISKVSYIVPPPTMGSGPSLKTHSYIGTNGQRVPIYAPADIVLKAGSHYVYGPYGLDFQVSCEVSIRFGHITDPVDSIKNLLPKEAQPDSRTQEVSPVYFKSGELIGYTTGTPAAGNWDFGAYDSSKNNRYISDPDWNYSDTYTKAVCPFDYFSPNLKSQYYARFNPQILGGNPPHGEPFCK